MRIPAGSGGCVEYSSEDGALSPCLVDLIAAIAGHAITQRGKILQVQPRPQAGRTTCGAIGLGAAPPQTCNSHPHAPARPAPPARARALAATLCDRRPDLLLLGRCGPPEQATVK